MEDGNSQVTKGNQGLLSSLTSSVKFFFKLAKYSSLRSRFLLLMIPWFAVGMTTYGLSFSVKLVEFDIFILTIIRETCTIIFVMIAIPVYQRVPRTSLLFTVYVVCGVSGIAFLLVPSSQVVARTVLYIFCIGMCSVNFYMVDTYTPEVFSTDTRNFTFTVLDGISKIGTTIAPFIVDLGGEENPGLPPAIFGSCMIIASLSFLFTPETKSKALMQTIEDLEEENPEKLIHKICDKAN